MIGPTCRPSSPEPIGGPSAFSEGTLVGMFSSIIFVYLLAENLQIFAPS